MEYLTVWNGKIKAGAKPKPLKLDGWPVGTKITVEVPLCPNCGAVPKLCRCGFDWAAWGRQEKPYWRDSDG